MPSFQLLCVKRSLGKMDYKWETSIHPFSCHWARGGVYPGQIASPSHDHILYRDKPFTLAGNLEYSINPTACLQSIGEKLRTWETLHTERHPRTFLLWTNKCTLECIFIAISVKFNKLQEGNFKINLASKWNESSDFIQLAPSSGLLLSAWSLTGTEHILSCCKIKECSLC